MRRTFVTGLLLAACAAIGVASAQQPTAGPAPLPVQAAPAAAQVAPPAGNVETHQMTAEDLRTFFDGMMPYAIHRDDIAGATLAVVKDGQIVFAQGYGYADLKTRKPVIADQTLFRPGSVSKLFTWTAVMQLVEQGKLDLDKDVNTYLDFKVPEAFGQPITLRNIMTHTSGFEESVSELFLQKPEQQYPIGQYLQKHMPKRIFPPFAIPAYSNYATSMAGYIVHRVSGQPYDDY